MISEAEVRETIGSYERLVEHAQRVAAIVANARNTTYRPRDPREYDILFDTHTVSARFYARGDYDRIEYPIQCLWLGDDQIVAVVSDQLAKERRLVEQKKQDEAAERERRERDEYERLKAKYDR